MMYDEYVILMTVAAVFAALFGMVRKPKFDIPEERQNGANLHWFSLVQGGEALLRIRQIYFDVGQAFKDAGWNIPNGTHDRLICLVVLESEIETVNAKGEHTWLMSLLTQGPVGDLYREMWKAVEMKQMKVVPKANLLLSPLSPNPKDEANITIRDMDSFEPNGAFNPTALIRHESHPTNSARSMYRMTKFDI